MLKTCHNMTLAVERDIKLQLYGSLMAQWPTGFAQLFLYVFDFHSMTSSLWFWGRILQQYLDKVILDLSKGWFSY